jgi:hypothetical protein
LGPAEASYSFHWQRSKQGLVRPAGGESSENMNKSQQTDY